MGNKLRKGGWQANIKYYKNYVIKTPKTDKEIRDRIRYHFEKTNTLDKMEIKVKKLKTDWKNSLRIINSGMIPPKVFAYLEFIKGGKIKQKRVRMLADEFEELMSNNNLKESKMLVDKVIEFILVLWQYGVHEVTFKFYTEMGIMDNEIVLVDIGELIDDKDLVRKQLEKGYKKILGDLRSYDHDDVLNYYKKQVKKKLTIKKLDEYWGKLIK
tara:strand:+ start:68 stop:706 length:639 start_codon:yes stop_codon:yes gene_type:complete